MQIGSLNAVEFARAQAAPYWGDLTKYFAANPRVESAQPPPPPPPSLVAAVPPNWLVDDDEASWIEPITAKGRRILRRKSDQCICPETGERLLDQNEVARILGLGQPSVNRYISLGLLPCIRSGLGAFLGIRRSDVEAFAELRRHRRRYRRRRLFSESGEKTEPASTVEAKPAAEPLAEAEPQVEVEGEEAVQAEVTSLAEAEPAKAAEAEVKEAPEAEVTSLTELPPALPIAEAIAEPLEVDDAPEAEPLEAEGNNNSEMRWMRLAAAARKFGVPSNALWKAVADGRLPHRNEGDSLEVDRETARRLASERRSPKKKARRPNGC